MKFFVFIFVLSVLFVGCAEQPIRKLVPTPVDEKIQAQRRAELREAFSLLVKAKELCMEMEDHLRIVKSLALEERLYRRALDGVPIDLDVAAVLNYSQECEEAFAAFKMLTPAERINKKELEWIFDYFKDHQWTSGLTEAEKNKVYTLLNIKGYPVSIPGFSKKRVELALKRVVFHLDRFQPDNLGNCDMWHRLHIEGIAEGIMLSGEDEPSGKTVERITQLIQKVFSMKGRDRSQFAH